MLNRPLFALADQLDKRKRYRWAEQFRSATLGITNNIAEGPESSSGAEIAQLLNICRRCLLEAAKVLLALRPK